MFTAWWLTLLIKSEKTIRIIKEYLKKLLILAKNDADYGLHSEWFVTRVKERIGWQLFRNHNASQVNQKRKSILRIETIL